MATVVFPAISKKVKASQAASENKFNKKFKLVTFPIGSHVMIKENAKVTFQKKYDGPFSVIHQTRGGTYTLKDETTNELLPRNFPPSDLKLISQDDVEMEEESYVVQAILNHRGPPGKREYLVQWKGYSSKDDSWIPPKNFNDTAFIDKYWKKRGNN
ncbi:hypothetical protein DFQ30_004911 [Apophysomyces sp. BC1015]|nr:hypothetical protein DFQ30_004911 [Apophysomyces sp. BC1015]